MTEAVKKNGVNFGIILGVVSVLITSTIYATDITNFVNIWLGISIFVVSLVILIVAVAKTKKAQNGFISFKEAFTTYFLAALIALLIGTVFNYILFNLIDPSAKETVTEETIKMTVEWMQKAGTPSADMKEAIEKMRENDNFSLGNQIKSFFFVLLFHIIIGLIVAAAFKKSKPELI